MPSKSKPLLLPPTALPGIFTVPKHKLDDLIVAVIVNSAQWRHQVIPLATASNAIHVDVHSGIWRPRFTAEALTRPFDEDMWTDSPYLQRHPVDLRTIFPDGPVKRNPRSPAYYYPRDCRIAIGTGLISPSLWSILRPDCADDEFLVIGVYDRTINAHLSQMILDCMTEYE